MKKFIIPLLFSFIGPVNAQQTADEFNRVLLGVCDKKVVLLGEDLHHGSGETLKVKVELTKQLVNKCGFSEIFFESMVYDFVDLENRIATRSVTSEQISDAIGALWSIPEESDPLIDFLFEQATSGRVRLHGLDPQVGGATQLYSQKFLSTDISRYLQQPRRDACQAVLQRLLSWGLFNDQHPYDDAAKNEVNACLLDIQKSIKKSSRVSEEALIAENLRKYMKFSVENFVNMRDRAMYENFHWYAQHFKRSSKSIIWCATIHAAKDLQQVSRDRHSMGEYIRAAYGDSSAVIAFSAARGSYQRRNKPLVKLSDATTDSLEGSAVFKMGQEIDFLNSAELERIGV